ncbi:MAG: PaREP1 family protein [Pyrobaculum sp.]
METLALPRRVVERLKTLAEGEGVSLEDFLLEMALRGLDPPDKAREYITAACQLLQAAEEELHGDLRQSSERIWGAAALAVKAYAYWRDGVRLVSHGDLWRYKSKMADELGEWVRDVWNSANSMHINFYEGWADKGDVERGCNT